MSSMQLGKNQFYIPESICCNCGTATMVGLQGTQLKHMPYMGMASSEITISISLPYCMDCQATANRRRPLLIGILAVTVLIWVALNIAWFFLAGDFVGRIPIELASGCLFLLSLGAVLGFYLSKKPSKHQTSYYQPVRLMKVKGKWPLVITWLELGFYNSEYKKLFDVANQHAISDGVLKTTKL